MANKNKLLSLILVVMFIMSIVSPVMAGSISETVIDERDIIIGRYFPTLNIKQYATVTNTELIPFSLDGEHTPVFTDEVTSLGKTYSVEVYADGSYITGVEEIVGDIIELNGYTQFTMSKEWDLGWGGKMGLEVNLQRNTSTNELVVLSATKGITVPGNRQVLDVTYLVSPAEVYYGSTYARRRYEVQTVNHSTMESVTSSFYKGGSITDDIFSFG